VARLLLAEDDGSIAEPLLRVLRREGYEVDHVTDGKEALNASLTGVFDLLLLDLGLPSMDGVEVCRRLRQKVPALRILMLTARADEVDKVVGLDAGADDYIAKPFGLAELLARVRALLRRADGPDQPDSEIESGPLRIDLASRRAWLNSRELELTLKEFDLLSLLASEAGDVVTRERIMDEVWDTNWFGSTKTLDMHVSALRRKLGDDPVSPRFVTTVRGVGYRFEVA
jgi:DNA-binding response OmpR family regulator